VIGFRQRTAARLERWHRSDRVRVRPALRGAVETIDFAGNDYLGLAREPRVIAACARAAERYGVGATGSALISGHTDAHAELESALAAFTGRPRALVFGSGYLANLAVVTTFAGRNETVIQDRLNHASLIDAAILSRARLLRYAHANPAALATCLQRVEPGRALVVTDGVFSMDGDLAPLPALAALCSGHQSPFVVDDAHGFGVLGAHGGGSAEYHGLGMDEVPILIGTFGKAFGGAGAFVAGDEAIIDALIQFGRTYIYTTAPPPALMGAMTASLRIIVSEPERRDRLRANIACFRQCAELRGLPVGASTTAIQPVFLGNAAATLHAARTLRDKGYRVAAIRPPTVPAGTERLRITISAARTVAEIEGLVAALAALA
jgi:8-amino-7-oxononanoate synthase